MKKLLLTLFAIVLSCGFISAQANLIVTAPNGLSTTAWRGPNGTSAGAYLRSCVLVLQSELAQIPATSTLTQFGFTLQTGTSGVAVPGNFTVYLQNTPDLTYQKGTNWANAITGMTSVFANVMTVPLSAGTTSIILTLSTPFVYGGNGLYVAYDWASSGPYSNTPATYFGDGLALLTGASTQSSSTAPPTTLVNTNFRPDFLFGFANVYTNEIQVIGIEAPGRIATVLNAAHTVSALVRNSSLNTLNNVPVTLNIIGSNPSVSTVTISSIAAGTSTLVSFPPLNPQLPGAQTASVTVPGDDFNGNNSATFQQSVTCDTWGRNPAVTSFTGTQVGFGSPGGIISARYDSPVNTNLSGIRVAISNYNININQTVYGVLMNAIGNIIGTTPPLILTNLTQGTIQYFQFASPIMLSANTTYYYGLAQTYGTNTNQYFPIATYLPTYQPLGLYYASNLTGVGLTPIASNFGFFGIEAVFQHTVTMSAQSQTINCGTTTTLNALSNTNYSWSTGATTSSIVVNPIITTVYTVAATNTMTCRAAAHVTVLVNPISISVVTDPTVACVGSPVNFTASGVATNYTWAVTGNTAYTSTFSDTPIANKTYTVKGKDLTTGCAATLVYSLTVNPLPIVNLSATTPTICVTKSITVTASGNASTYSWSSGPATASAVLSPAASSIFTVTGTSSLGCVANKTVDVTVNDFTPGITPPTSLCVGQSTVLTAIAAGGIKWDNFQTFASITVTPGVTTGYTVTGTGANGCTGTNTTMVTVHPNPVVSAVATRTSICRKESTVLTATGAVTYSWTTGALTYSTVVTPTAAVPYNYTVTGTNAEGCSMKFVVPLKVNPCTGLEEYLSSSFSLYPNPASRYLNVRTQETGFLELFDLTGKQVLKQEVGPETPSVSVAHLTAGIYSAVFRTPQGSATVKLVIE